MIYTSQSIVGLRLSANHVRVTTKVAHKASTKGSQIARQVIQTLIFMKRLSLGFSGSCKVCVILAN
jgi:hypothetical protein